MGFVSRLALIARQEDFSLTLAGYDFGDYTFQLGRLALLNQGTGRVASAGEAEFTLQDPGADDDRQENVFDTGAILRVSTMSLTLGIAAWALRSGGLLAAMLSSLPAWRQVDLLPILGDPDKRKGQWGTADTEAEREERAVDRIFDGSVPSRGA